MPPVSEVLFNHILFYSIIVLFIGGGIRYIWSKANPVYIAVIFSFLIYFSLNWDMLLERNDYIMAAFSSFSVFFSTIGLAQLGGSFVGNKETKNPLFKGFVSKDSSKKPHFFSKWF